MRLNEAALSASRVLKERRDTIAERVTTVYFESHPQLELRWKGARQKCTEDTRLHLENLSDALSFGEPSFFSEYAVWVAALLAGLHIPGEALASNLAILRTAVVAQLNDSQLVSAAALASRYLDEAIATIEGDARPPSGCLAGTGVLDILARDYLAALLRGDRQIASKMIVEAAQRGVEVKQIYLQVFQRSQFEVGRLWQTGEISVAKEHYCTAATQLIMSQLYPYVFSGEKNGSTYVGTCVYGNLHELGSRMVADFFEMAGWDSFYLGASTPARSVVETLVEHKAQVLGVSATLTNHVGAVEELIQCVREEPACAGVGILVGGYPFNLAPDLWRVIGAVGCARDADSAIKLAGRLAEVKARKDAVSL